MKKKVLFSIIAVLLAVIVVESVYLITKKSNEKILAGSIEKVEYAAKNWWEAQNLELLNVDEDEKVAVDIDDLVSSNYVNESDLNKIDTSGCVLIDFNENTNKLEYTYNNTEECEIYNYNLSVEISDNCTVNDETVLYGDIDLDGKVTAKDRTYLTRYLSGWEGYELYCNAMLNADLNLDKVVDLDDLSILVKHLANWEGYNKLPMKSESIECEYSNLTATLGDVDKDGEVTSKDRTILSRYLNGDVSLDCQALLNADVNTDGKVDSEDLNTLAKHIAGWTNYEDLNKDNSKITCDYSNLTATLGDVDKDGEVTSKDRTVLSRYLNGNNSLDCQALLNADVNTDGKVDSEDLNALAKHIAGWTNYEDLDKDNSKITCDYSNLTATLGDVDKDGKVTSKDRTTLSRYLSGNSSLDCQALLNADVNADGKVDNDDLNALAKHIAGWDGYEDLSQSSQTPSSNDSGLKANYGDVDKDGKVTAKDRTTLSRYLNGNSSLDNQALLNADVNVDGKVDEKDLEILTRYIAGWDGYKSLPKTN